MFDAIEPFIIRHLAEIIGIAALTIAALALWCAHLSERLRIVQAQIDLLTGYVDSQWHRDRDRQTEAEAEALARWA